MTTRTLPRWLPTAVALAALTTAAGCNLVAGAYLIASGPEKTPAVATLPKERSAVILIDDRANVVPQRSLRDMIGKTAEEEILKEQLVKEMVAARLATAVLARERYGQPMGIAEIGQAVQADVVIYVSMTNFSLSEDGTTITPFASANVKLIESKTGTRLSPPETDPADSHPLIVRLPAQTNTAGAGGATAQQHMMQDLARLTGIYLSRMFYDAEKITAPRSLDDK